MNATQTDFAKHLDFKPFDDAPNGSQGISHRFAECPQWDLLRSLGWNYSHTSRVHKLDGTPYAQHTFRFPGTKYVVGVNAAPGWPCGHHKLGSGHTARFQDLKTFSRFIKRKTSQINRETRTKRFEIREGDGNDGTYRRGYVIAADAFDALQVASRKGLINKPYDVKFSDADGDSDHASLASFVAPIFGDACRWIAEANIVPNDNDIVE